VPRFENSFNIISVRYMCEILSNNSYIKCRKLLLNEQTCINCFKHNGDAPFLTKKNALYSQNLFAGCRLLVVFTTYNV